MPRLDKQSFDNLAQQVVNQCKGNEDLVVYTKKIAVDKQLNDEQIRRLSRAVNVKYFEQKMASMKKEKDRYVDYDIVDDESLIRSLSSTPSREKKAEAIYPDLIDEFAPVETFEKVATDYTEFLPEDPDPWLMARRWEKVAEELGVKITGTEMSWDQDMNELKSQISKNGFNFNNFEKSAVGLYGDDIIFELNVLRKYKGKEPIQTKVANIQNTIFGKETKNTILLKKAADARINGLKFAAAKDKALEQRKLFTERFFNKEAAPVRAPIKFIPKKAPIQMHGPTPGMPSLEARKLQFQHMMANDPIQQANERNWRARESEAHAKTRRADRHENYENAAQQAAQQAPQQTQSPDTSFDVNARNFQTKEHEAYERAQQQTQQSAQQPQQPPAQQPQQPPVQQQTQQPAQQTQQPAQQTQQQSLWDRAKSWLGGNSAPQTPYDQHLKGMSGDLSAHGLKQQTPDEMKQDARLQQVNQQPEQQSFVDKAKGYGNQAFDWLNQNKYPIAGGLAAAGGLASLYNSLRPGQEQETRAADYMNNMRHNMNAPYPNMTVLASLDEFLNEKISNTTSPTLSSSLKDTSIRSLSDQLAKNVVDRPINFAAKKIEKHFFNEPKWKKNFDETINSDPMLTEAFQKNPQMLSDAFESLKRFSPTLAKDRLATRSLLRQNALSGGEMDFGTIKMLAEAQKHISESEKNR